MLIFNLGFFSVSYMPVTQNGAYDVPVMARRDLHGEYRGYSSSNYRGGMNSLISTPGRIVSNIKSQITNGCSAIRDRFTRPSTDNQSGSLVNSSFTDKRDSRSSSQSSNTRYNTRRTGTPVHSTPRDTESEHRKSSSKKHKDRQSQDEDRQNEDDQTDHESLFIRIIKKIFHAPIDILKFLFGKIFALPWWLLIPLLLFLGFYACKIILWSILSLIFSCFSS